MSIVNNEVTLNLDFVFFSKIKQNKFKLKELAAH